MPTAEQTEFKAYLDKHGVEEAMSVAVDRLMKMKERPPDPVAFIGRILCSIDATATKPEDTEAQAALRTKVGTVLAPLKGTTETEKSTHKHALPEALQKFVTLAEEPAIIEVAKPLQALEAAVARAPDSREAAAALEAALGQLTTAMKAKIEERADQADLKALIEECEAAVSAGNRDFQKVYASVWAVLQSGEEHLLPRFQAAVAALLARIKDPKAKLLQRKEAKAPTTLLVDAARAKPSFEVVVEELAALVPGAQLVMTRVGELDKHGHETSGLKKLQRVVEKSLLKPEGEGCGDADTVCDVARAMVGVQDFGGGATLVDGLVRLDEEGVVEILRQKDRFFEIPSPGGWRDLMINLVIVGDESRHVCEIQIVHEMMLTARKGLPGHEVYNKVRTAMEFVERLGKQRELRREAVRKLRAGGGGDPQVIALSEDAWLLGDEEWVKCAGDAAKLAAKVKADEEGRVKEVNLSSCEQMKELPASVGRLQALQKLNLSNCSGLTSLPAEVGSCAKLESLYLTRCSGLTSLPDLSGLEKLEVYNLPSAMKPWEERGRKAFALPTEG